MKRLLSWVPAIIAVFAIAFFAIHAYLPKMVASDLAEKLEVKVTIEDISPFPTQIKITDIAVLNPSGSLLPKAATVEEMHIKAPLTHYFKDRIVIEEISLEDIYLGLEFNSANSTEGNWSTLMKNAVKNTPPSKGKEREVLIQKLVLTNIEVELAYRDNGTVRKLPRIDQIVLTNIDTAKGLPLDQIMQTVLGQMLKSVFIKENLKNMLDGILEQPKSTLDSLISPFKNLFEG